MINSSAFDNALYGVSDRLRASLIRLSTVVKGNTEEIRIRKYLPLTLTVSGETVFVTKNGQTSFSLNDEVISADEDDLDESFRLLCRGSAYAHGEELKRGFIMMKNGCRAGIGGSIGENGVYKSITSVNIRIAKQIHGAANDILRSYSGGGLLIAGPPGSGKTTVLRDFVRQLSNGYTGKIIRMAVIDSRGELSAGGNLDLGVATDTVICSDKAAGLESAVRTLFPEAVAFDEIGTAEELEKVTQGFYSGVKILTTAHIGDKGELMKRKVTRSLILSGVIDQIALLPKIHGADIGLISAKELSRAAVI